MKISWKNAKKRECTIRDKIAGVDSDLLSIEMWCNGYHFDIQVPAFAEEDLRKVLQDRYEIRET